ncbi:MAG: hypothetical protein KUG78_15365 [Kangiellaceae bacterium]|nr:hypothetical protein [Kangiellaceae bacterium]
MMTDQHEEQQENSTMSKSKNKTPGWPALILGVIFPLFVIAFEIYTGMCAESFFDPMPTIYHKFLVLLVPICNLMLWWKLRYGSHFKVGLLLTLAAISLGVAGYYSIIFLPLMPIALIAIVFFGLGLLPFGPLISFIITIRLFRQLREKHQVELGNKHYLLKGVSVAILALIMLDIPSAATYFGANWAANESSNTRAKGIKLLRAFGDEDLLLRLSYDGSRRATGLLSFFAIQVSDSGVISSTKAREIFYQVTGEPFNMRPVPYTGRSWSRFNDMRFDTDQGGTEVGGRVKGLDLVSSRLDGSVSGDDGVAYLEWVLEFKNSSFRQREARVQIALPPESVVSRATLWVNGEEREAAFAGKSKAQRAYQSVVRTRRDPLLVTTLGTDRILAQAFPIEPNGGTIKFRIGITAPLVLDNLKQASLVLPAIVDRNFSINDNVEHAIWIESEQPIDLNLPRIRNESITANLHRVSGNASDVELSGERRKLETQRNPDVKLLISQSVESELVVQEIIKEVPNENSTLLIVIDGSVNIGPYVDDVIESLNQIPINRKVGVMIASEENLSVEIAQWSDSHKQEIVSILSRADFNGGQDNAPALAEAIKQLERYDNAELLWIHAPQPILFEGSTALLEQATNRLLKLPEIFLYSVKPGPNKLLDDSKWVLASKTIPKSGPVKTDLGNYFDSMNPSKIQWIFKRTLTIKDMSVATGSQHIARLWAKDKVYSLIAKDENDDAINLAAKYQLVTAVSGAVVLENQQQYKDNDLTPVDENSVPTIPEPHQWILAFIMVAFLLWFLKQNKLPLIRRI